LRKRQADAGRAADHHHVLVGFGHVIPLSALRGF
jgi:hypothetical protein